MTDWRQRFPDDSRVSWERRLEEAAGTDAWEIARPFLVSWRRDSASPDARRLEAHLAASIGVNLATAFESGDPLDALDEIAVREVITATRHVLRRAGADRLTLYRGQPVTVELASGDRVELSGRGLTAWTPAREIAIGHAARRRPAAVFVAEIEVEQVAFGFDPSSDGEIVLLGAVPATVDTLVP